MLDQVAKALQVASALALAWVGLFNIGFFVEVSFEFVGMMDLSSLLVAFGGAFGFFFIVILLVAGVVIDFAVKHQDNQLAWGTCIHTANFAIAAFAMASTLIATFVPAKYLPTFLIGLSGAAFSLFILSVLGLVTGLASYQFKKEAKYTPLFLGLGFLAAFTVVFGMYRAERQIFDADIFIVRLKDNTQLQARILRANTSSLLLAINGAVVLVPQSEVKSINETKQRFQAGEIPG